MNGYYFDENLSRRLAAMLAALGVIAVHQSEHFPAGTPDTIWIPEIGRREYVLITWDRKTRTRPAEAEALRKFGVTTVYGFALCLARSGPDRGDFVQGFEFLCRGQIAPT